MASKNVLRSSNDEYGIWKISVDTLKLYDNENRPPAKFIMIDDKKNDFFIS